MSISHELINAFSIYCFIFFTGAILGSFLNVVISRLPIMIENNNKQTAKSIINPSEVQKKIKFNLIFPSSHCFSCKKKIRFFDNIPILSYLRLKGKCSKCQSSIRIRYFIIELFSGFILVINFLCFTDLHQFIIYSFLFYLLLSLSLIDIENLILPNELTNLLLWFGILVNLNNSIVLLKESIFGIVFSYLFLKLISQFYLYLTSREGIGIGDIYLSCAIAAWIGIIGIIFVIFISSILGLIFFILLLIFKKRKITDPIPFGPFLSTSTFFYIFSQKIIYF